jgi:hypothetical protein
MSPGDCLELISSQAAGHRAALGVSHWLGVAVEFARNFFPIPESPRRGHSLAKQAEEHSPASCPLEGTLTPSWGKPAPSALVPRPYREIAMDQRDSQS